MNRSSKRLWELRSAADERLMKIWTQEILHLERAEIELQEALRVVRRQISNIKCRVRQYNRRAKKMDANRGC